MPAAAPASPGTPLVLTKLRPPASRDLVPRPALVERLAAGPRRRLTVVRAPAGWGKTTLLSAWSASPAEPRAFAWLQLDAADTGAGRFWSYVVQALQTLDERLGQEAMPLFKAPGVDLQAEALPVLLNEIVGMKEPGVLVLDDFHLVESAAVHAAVAWFAEHLPPALELAIATRTEPDLPLARMRARGELLEIDDELLRFSESETEALLNRVARLDLAPADVAALRRRTEGWAAGLYLAALSLRDRDDRARFIEAFYGDDRHVVDYLSSEVLSGLDPGLRDFLVQTSVLDRLTGSLCDAVVDAEGSARLLRDIERSNLFLVPLDDRRHVYRYHHLFGDVLRHELDVLHPGRAPELHRRAARWHLADGDADRAVMHTIAAGDDGDAAELVAEHWSDELLKRGAHHMIDAWLRALPAGTVAADPRLCVAKVFTGHSLGRAHEVTRWVDAAEAALPPGAPARILGDVAAARASNALQTGDLTTALCAAERAMQVGDLASPWTPIPYGVRAHVLRWRGHGDAAVVAFGEWLCESEVRGQLLGVVCSHAVISLIHAEAGRVDEARAEAERALELGGAAFREHWVTLDAHATLAMLASERGATVAAAASARRTVELAGRGGPPADRANALLHAARILGGDEAALVAQAASLLAAGPDPGPLVLDRLRESQDRTPSRSEPVEGDELSERELAVLRLLATDLSQREIGEALYVSLNTVKTHARHIFRKLGASGREDAVERARRMGALR